MRKEKRVYRHEVILFNENVGKEPFQYGCYLIFGLCVVYLTLLSFFSTSSVQLKKVTSEWEPERLEEHIFFLPDSPWKHLAVCLCLLLLLCFVFSFFKKKINQLYNTKSTDAGEYSAGVGVCKKSYRV